MQPFFLCNSIFKTSIVHLFYRRPPPCRKLHRRNLLIINKNIQTNRIIEYNFCRAAHNKISLNLLTAYKGVSKINFSVIYLKQKKIVNCMVRSKTIWIVEKMELHKAEKKTVAREIKQWTMKDECWKNVRFF